MNRLHGKVAIVTGAGTGLGRETAILYAQEGARVVAGDIREPEGVETVAAIRAAGGEAIFVKVDVSQSAEVRELVASAERHYGALHIMTANAGILGTASGKLLTEMTEEEFWRVIHVNLGGVFLSFKHAAPAILRAGGGAMTSTGSLGGHRAATKLAAYGASKAAIAGLVRALALELYPAIRVNDVAPGGMPTQILDHQDEERGVQHKAGPSQWGAAALNTREVARAHLYLVCEDSAFVTGQTLFVDAGRSVVMAPPI